MIHIDLFLAGWALAALLMLVAWVVQWRTGDAGMVDVAWAAGLGLLAVAGVWTLAMPLLLVIADRWDGMAETARTSAEPGTSGTADKSA